MTVFDRHTRACRARTASALPESSQSKNVTPPALSPGQTAADALLRGPHRHVCLAGGARAGKTFLIVREIMRRATKWPESRHAILRLHANAARASIAQDTLLQVNRCYSNTELVHRRQDAFYELKNGSRISVGGLDTAQRVEKILGQEFATVFLNEASQIPYESALVAQTRLAQKIDGLAQRFFVDLNPTSKTHWTNILFNDKRDPISLQPLASPDDYGIAYLNPRDNADNLTPEFLAGLAALPERHRRRFYEGLYADDLDDALWTLDLIEKHRVSTDYLREGDRQLTVVAVDPAGGHRPHSGDHHGIVVAALGTDNEAYVLADYSCRGNAEYWSRRVAEAMGNHDADRVIAETNYGGDMVRATIAAAIPNARVYEVTASRGKWVRADPISVRYAQGQVHHVGRLAELETQLCGFTATGYQGAGSPDRADAAIWALSYLFKDGQEPGALGFMRDQAAKSPP